MRDLIEQAAKLLGVQPVELADGSTILHIPTTAVPLAEEPEMSPEAFDCWVLMVMGSAQNAWRYLESQNVGGSYPSVSRWRKDGKIPAAVRRAVRLHCERTARQERARDAGLAAGIQQARAALAERPMSAAELEHQRRDEKRKRRNA